MIIAGDDPESIFWSSITIWDEWSWQAGTLYWDWGCLLEIIRHLHICGKMCFWDYASWDAKLLLELLLIIIIRLGTNKEFQQLTKSKWAARWKANYLVHTQLDIVYAVSVVSQLMHDPW